MLIIYCNKTAVAHTQDTYTHFNFHFIEKCSTVSSGWALVKASSLSVCKVSAPSLFVNVATLERLTRSLSWSCVVHGTLMLMFFVDVQ